jgi:hypothetical protein
MGEHSHQEWDRIQETETQAEAGPCVKGTETKRKSRGSLVSDSWGRGN